MARTVDEIMNRELVGARKDERPERMRDIILALGITALPVLDDERRPIGVVSLRDLVASDVPRARVMPPAATIPANASVLDAAKLVADTDYHHLVVVDAERRAVGVVSCLDLLRALVGVPTRHPATFPHYDRKLGVEWSDDTELKAEALAAVPTSAGVIVLVHGGPGMHETPVWVEATHDLRARLEEMVTSPGAMAPHLARLLDRAWIRFRVASVSDEKERITVLVAVRAELDARAPHAAAATG
jgi:CBS domain-containing protein